MCEIFRKGKRTVFFGEAPISSQDKEDACTCKFLTTYPIDAKQVLVHLYVHLCVCLHNYFKRSISIICINIVKFVCVMGTDREKLLFLHFLKTYTSHLALKFIRIMFFFILRTTMSLKL